MRLPVYQRALLELSAGGVPTVSSAELAEAAGVNAAKVRKDLSHLGTYGTPGHRLRRQLPARPGPPRARPRPGVAGRHRRHGQPRSRARPLAALLDPELPGGRPVRRRSRTRSARRSRACRSAMSPSWRPSSRAPSRSIGVIASPGQRRPGRVQPARGGRRRGDLELRPGDLDACRRRCCCARSTSPSSCRCSRSTWRTRRSAAAPAGRVLVGALGP